MKKLSRREFVPLIGSAVAGLSFLSLSNSSSTPYIGPTSEFTPVKALKKDDTIGICAPAGAVTSPREVDDFETVLHSLGFKTKRGNHILNQYGYLAGTDTERATDFMSLIEDDTVNAIFFVRGGWGCNRLLPLLDFDTIGKHPKIIMGFSDVTTLLNAITLRCKFITFHGPSGNSTWNEYSIKYIEELLINKHIFTYKNEADDAKIHTYTSGQATGDLIGGNLTVLTSMIGSGYLPNWEKKLLFLEDVKEEPYSIDRMLMQLKLNGAFDQVNGIILGNFRKCYPENPDRSFSLTEVFEQYFKNCDIPVFYGAQIGHTRNKFTVPVGGAAYMDADEGIFGLRIPAVY